MKKLTSLFVFYFGLYFTSMGYIDSVKIQPSIIYPTDIVTFIDFVTWPSYYTPQKDSIQINGSYISLHGTYYMGGLAGYESGSDTFTLGAFPPGVYKILFSVDTYSGPYHMQSDTVEISFTVLAPNALCEIQEGNIISLYPNPIKNQLTLSTSNFQPQTISIYNLQGQQVQQMKYTPQIDVSALSAGMYVLEVEGQSGVVRRKFVKE